ncbi:LacI family DNA-binding transcriptional regulator [Duganella sp. Root1480D1]|uniref:LacI family DNA-binding transcriptional regulator n=1 Tax=Duganella sp. Root1480D1 TaxID=1736471 RepID=UPI00070B8E37|nr:LacI family DNA-binding transcriptional regulator [Duganella sp. Root1480D1]KQZ44947.1 LacI family transcriptional regulator [Duganella sp. Root1480D1]
MKKNVATIRDVAAAAGVSTATVSKFVNGAQRFSPAVEARLTSVIEELGYRSNPMAQSMITGRTKAIGLSVLDITNPHYASVVKGANRVAQAHGYTLLLVDTEETPERERQLLEALSRRVDGMIVYSRTPEEELSWLLALDRPSVFFGRPDVIELPSVASDDQLGAFMVTRHLLAQGHKRVGYLGFSNSRRNPERMAGVREALAAQGLELAVFEAEAPTSSAGEKQCSSIMLGRQPLDALVCFNDLLALGFMKAAQTLGFRVPEDISVVGFDNIQFGNFASPALTSVDLNSEQMGAAAMEKLLASIEGHAVEPLTVVNAQLVLRASTATRS